MIKKNIGGKVKKRTRKQKFKDKREARGGRKKRRIRWRKGRRKGWGEREEGIEGLHIGGKESKQKEDTRN